eukprot:SM000025S08458  [mRNA]  locus=s25:857682:864361:- [translate_table: standard]
MLAQDLRRGAQNCTQRRPRWVSKRNVDSDTTHHWLAVARDGDALDLQAMLAAKPVLAKYTAFGGSNSPLLQAEAKGHVEPAAVKFLGGLRMLPPWAQVVRLLLKHGAKANLCNQWGQTALMHACRQGFPDIVQLLLAAGSDVLKKDSLSMRNALHYAAGTGRLQCLVLLLAAFVAAKQISTSPSPPPANASRRLMELVSTRAANDVSALHMAALKGQVECLQLLLLAGADVNCTTATNSTPLHYAACGGSHSCCAALLGEGADKSVQDNNGWTPLQVSKLCQKEWLEGLLDPAAGCLDTGLGKMAPQLASIIKLVLSSWSVPFVEVEPEVMTDACGICLERRCTVSADAPAAAVDAAAIAAARRSEDVKLLGLGDRFSLSMAAAPLKGFGNCPAVSGPGGTNSVWALNGTASVGADEEKAMLATGTGIDILGGGIADGGGKLEGFLSLQPKACDGGGLNAGMY